MYAPSSHVSHSLFTSLAKFTLPSAMNINSSPLSIQVPFDMLVAHVDESGVCGLPESAFEQRKEAIWDSVRGSINRESLLVVSLEDVFLLQSCGSTDTRSRLDRRKQLQSLVQVRLRE